MAIRVFVVDDSDVFRDAIRDVVRACADFELAGEAHTGEEALTQLCGTATDVVLIDVHLPGIDGLELVRQLRSRQPDQFVMLCSVASDPRLTDGDLDLEDVIFLPKARISPRSLRDSWSAHFAGSSS